MASGPKLPSGAATPSNLATGQEHVDLEGHEHLLSRRTDGRAAGGGLVGIKSLVGGVDARSRIEPIDVTKHARLLPAIDGIQPW